VKYALALLAVLVFTQRLSALTEQPLTAAAATYAIDACPGGNCDSAAASEGLIRLAAVWDKFFVKVEKDDPAYAPIGIVATGTNASTAFLINDCHVLTTYHTLYDRGPADTSRQFQVMVGKSTTADFEDGAFGTVVVHGNFEPEPHATCEDFAVLRLNRCLGQTYGHVDVAPFSLQQVLDLQNDYGKAVKSAGYPRTEGVSQISVDEGVVHGMHFHDPQAYGHTCGAMRGSSGSPLFFELPERDRLVAFGMVTEVTTIEGLIDDHTRLTGEDATEPAFFNKAVPMECIYDRIRPYLPAPHTP
jgi:hypothetical protein